MRAALALAALAALALAAGCPKRADLGARTGELVRAADKAWGRRGEIGFEAAGAPLLEAYGLSPDDPRVLWRIARWRVAEGLCAADPAVARSSFAEARATAAACLDDDPTFAERRAAEGWAAALEILPHSRRPCAAWTAFAWVRWMEIHGADAAALDLEAIDALAAATESDGDLAVAGVSAWAAGISLAIRPEWAGRDLRAARTELEQATRIFGGSAVARADLLRLVVAPAGTDAERAALEARIASMEPEGPEDVRAQQRVASGE